MLGKKITIGEKYGPAMKIITQEEAGKYFEQLVEHTMSFGHCREEAEGIEKQNLGYYAGYYNDAIRERVERLFSCKHPVFGAIKDGAPTPEEAFQAGLEFGEKHSGEGE